TLVAYFIEESVETYTLTLVANPVEGGLVIGGGEFAEGEVVTVTAQPSEGYQFVNWVITVPEALEGTEVSTEATTTFTMLAADVTLTANFEMEQPETYTVTFIVTNNQENSVEGATIAIDGIYDELITDASGMTTIELEDGEYGYSVTKEGFEAESGTFTVAGEDIAVDVELTTVGLNTDMLSNIEVFPNPFSSSITLNNVGKASRVVVTSLIGQKVMEVKLSGAERETIQTESLANGIYLIQIYNANGGRTVRKMMKE
ncbi:MAG TPA: T9SS type A sorting domain-containing protein, partial [Tenuifilaceae bacterium]|nr:T9SS type A sorting domain-containing protein [Tenuifilaceae bacterium]